MHRVFNRITMISSVESQKGVIAILCTAIAPFWFSSDDMMVMKSKITTMTNKIMTKMKMRMFKSMMMILSIVII